MRKQLYQAIVERLKTIIDAGAEAPVVKHFALWHADAFTAADTEPGFATPAVFVEFLPVEWKPLGGNVQAGNVQLRVHIVERTPRTTQDSMELFDLAETVSAYLAGLRSEGFGQLQHIESLTNHEHTQMRECMETFRTTVR